MGECWRKRQLLYSIGRRREEDNCELAEQRATGLSLAHSIAGSGLSLHLKSQAIHDSEQDNPVPLR